MKLIEMAVLYGLVGVGAAVAVAVRNVDGENRVLDAILLLGFWPLYGPFVLARWRGREGLFPNSEAAFVSALRRASGTPLAALLPDQHTVRALARRLRVAAAKVTEIDGLLGLDEFSEPRASRRILDLRRRGASDCALATARMRIQNIRRLRRLRNRFARELDEVGELLAQLHTQAEVVRLAGAPDEGTRELVDELVSRVEGLDRMLDDDAYRAEALHPDVGGPALDAIPLSRETRFPLTSKLDTVRQLDPAMAKILVVDDEARIRDVVQYALEREGFEVLLAADGNEALEKLRTNPIDLVVLDVLMPELDGLSVCRKIREISALPVIFLSSRTEEVDRILGLELGGDDYVTKPFSPRELAIRVKTVLRRAAPGAGDEATRDRRSETIVHGPIEMSLPRHEVRVSGVKIELTVTEFGVLSALLERPGLVLTRSQLIDRAYAQQTCITERTIDTHIRRIRAKLRSFGIDPIETVHGLGYKAGEIEG